MWWKLRQILTKIRNVSGMPWSIVLGTSTHGLVWLSSLLTDNGGRTANFSVSDFVTFDASNGGLFILIENQFVRTSR